MLPQSWVLCDCHPRCGTFQFLEGGWHSRGGGRVSCGAVRGCWPLWATHLNQYCGVHLSLKSRVLKDSALLVVLFDDDLGLGEFPGHSIWWVLCILLLSVCLIHHSPNLLLKPVFSVRATQKLGCRNAASLRHRFFCCGWIIVIFLKLHWGGRD